MDGNPIRSCFPIERVGDASITTIEEIGETTVGRNVQKAWLDLEVVQCGYCQSGQIMSATASRGRPTYGGGQEGPRSLDIQWDEGPNATLSTADIVRQMEAASQKPGAVARRAGDLDKAMAGAKTKLDAIYQLPFRAHTTMEPINCTAHVRKDSCEIWVGTQVMTRAQSVAASIWPAARAGHRA